MAPTLTRLPTFSIHTFYTVKMLFLWEITQKLSFVSPPAQVLVTHVNTTETLWVIRSYYNVNMERVIVRFMRFVLVKRSYFASHVTRSLIISVFCRYQSTLIFHIKHTHSKTAITIILSSTAATSQSVSGQRSSIALCVAASSIHNLAFRCLIDCHW